MCNRLTAMFLLVIFLITGCATQNLAVQDPLLFASLDDFKLGPGGGVDLVWSTKRISDAESLKVNLQKYDSLILDQTWLVIDKESVHQFDDGQVLATSRQMVNEIKARLGHEYKLVESPTENTLLVSIALTNLETSLPILAATNYLLPDNVGSAPLSTVVVGQQPKDFGFIVVELLVRDAKTREPLVAVIDSNIEEFHLATMVHLRERRKEFISLWADRLWTTLSYWNWIKSRTSSP